MFKSRISRVSDTVVVFTELAVAIHQPTTLRNFLEGSIEILCALEIVGELRVVPQTFNCHRVVFMLNSESRQQPAAHEDIKLPTVPIAWMRAVIALIIKGFPTTTAHNLLVPRLGWALKLRIDLPVEVFPIVDTSSSQGLLGFDDLKDDPTI